MTVNSYIGRFGRLGVGKEVTPGTLQPTLTNFLPFIPPESIFVAHAPLESKSIMGVADGIVKMSPGPLTVNGAKFKIYAEPENIGELLMGAFGVDTVAEVASFIVSAGVNDKIDFTENGGAAVAATLPAGTYAMGASSAVTGSLCALIKSQMQAVGTGTYTVTYSFTTKKLTITQSTGVFVIEWLTGTHNATSAAALLGFSKTDTASAIAATSDSAAGTAPFSHTFTRLQSAVLPTYTLWLDKQAGATPNFTGAMANKLSFEVKAKEYLTADADFNALQYTSDSSQTAIFSALKPFTFNEAVITAGGVISTAYDTVKVEIDNAVKADHVVGSSRYPQRIYSEGFTVKLSLDFFLNDLVEYAAFLAGTASSLTVQLNSAAMVSGAVPYSLTFTVPKMMYTAAPRQLTSNVLKIPFQASAFYDLGGTNETMQAVLVNSVSTAY